MMRNADPHDLDFIFDLVIAEAEEGHFTKELLGSTEKRGFRLELISVLGRLIRIDGTRAFGLVWTHAGKSIGFVLMSAGPDNKGNELWMAAISPEQRKAGQGRAMISTVLEQFKGKNLKLFARCHSESEAMFHILASSGFNHIATGETGVRGLAYTL